MDIWLNLINFDSFLCWNRVSDSELKSRPDTKDFGLKQIEGTGLSMSACREIAVSCLIAPKRTNAKTFAIALNGGKGI